MRFNYKTKGTCSSMISFDMENGKIFNVEFQNGCNGNLKGISNLVEGMSIAEVKEKLSGIQCGFKTTSCPDQLAQAVTLAEKQIKGIV